MSKSSQQSHSYYVDDIPIVITDKWRLPPLPNISEDLVRPFFRDKESTPSEIDGSDHQGQYTFTLEQKVLDKIGEWQSARDRELQEREERLRARREEKLRRIEAEESRLKERLTQVSYPSPDEFSSSSDDEAESQPKHDDDDKVYQGTFFDSILKPTVIQSRPCSATDLQLRAKKSQAGSLWAGTGQNNVNKIELADFENDATDPFYNVELKTIDDLDVLAQVLQSSNMLHSKDKSKENGKNREITVEEKGNTDQIKNETKHKEVIEHLNNNGTSTATVSAVISDNPSIYSSYAPSYSNYSTEAPAPALSYLNAFSSYNHQPLTTTYANDYAPAYTSTASYLATSTFTNGQIDYQHFNNHHHHGQEQGYLQEQVQEYQTNYKGLSTVQPVSNLVESKLRSKSVPDIVQELENEVKDSERRRIRNNSQSAETARNTAHNAVRSLTENNSDNSRTTQTNRCDDLLKNLPLELQNLIKNISQMGFPLDRVFRVAEQFQGDDKKIIEHLIPLSELLDLGFEEKRISEALIKFDNNKDKALDFLIS